MKKGILNKLTIVDYIIIIAVICAVVFAFIHITTDDSNDTKTSSYDSSTMNKIVENYLKLYLEGNVVETTVSGARIQRPASSGLRRSAATLGQSCRWTDTPKPRVIKPTTGSPGTGVQHLANFTRQLSRPFTMIPDSLFRPALGGGAEAAPVAGWIASWVARSAACCSAWTRPRRAISSLMRTTAFWADMPP